MTTEVEQYKAIKSQTLALIKDITLTPKPTYSVGGQSFSWQQYLEQLQKTVDWCNTRLEEEDPQSGEDHFFEVQSRGSS